MKNIIKILIFLVIGSIIALDSNLIVKAYSNQETFSANVLNGFYIKKLHSNGSGQYKSIGKITRNSDGHFVYCVQPWMELSETDYYTANTTDQAAILGVSTETWDRLSLISYYGYGYPGHDDERWYGITQLMIWQTVDPDGSFFFTYTANGDRDYRYDWMKDEIESLISKHYTKPNFNTSSLTLDLGNSVTLKDTNNILSDYTITTDNNNLGVSANGNNLVIKANNVGTTKITLTKNSNSGIADFTPVLYNYADKQKTIARGYVDPIVLNLNVSVVGGKIKVKKVDSETKQIIAQGAATMVGSVYDIKDSSNNIVDTITIGNDSTALTKELKKGTYKIVERSSGTGYKVNSKVYEVTISESKTYEITVEDEVIKAKVNIFKYDSKTKKCISSGEASLAGAKYKLKNSKGEVVDTLTIDSNCKATSKLVPYDTYTLVETESGTGYKLDTNTYQVVINSNNNVDITVYEDVKEGRVKILKLDKDNNNTTARGQATLVGAEYLLKKLDGTIVDTLVIDENYQAISKKIPFGHYILVESKASKGYTLDPTVYEINIEEDEQVIEITSKEKVIEVFVSILKQFDYIEGQTAFLNSEPDIEFTISYPDGTLYDTIKTDKHGYSTFLLPYGIWKFHQVNSNIGYEKIYDFYITVDENSEEEQYYNILNNEITAYLQVVKQDIETGKVIELANTKFKILNLDTNQYVSQYVAGKVYDTFETDNSGKFITYLKLTAGNYKLVEVSSPKNYLLNTDGLEFTIGDDTHYVYTNYGPVITVYFKDKQIKGIIEINKDGEIVTIDDNTFNYNGRKDLEGITYNVEAAEDIMSADGNYIYYTKGTIVDTITTNNSGYGKSKELPLGKYIVYEISTSDSYILDEKQYEIELKELNNKTPIVYENLKLTNLLKKGSFEFTKTDLVTGQPIANTGITIFMETEDEDKIIFKGKTDDKGKIIINDLPLGKYYLIETDCEGYVITDEKVYFEIKENNEVVKAEMTNKPITNDIELTKLDFSTDEPIANTLIELYNADTDELIFSDRTDGYGKIIFKNVRYGRYYLIEKETSDSSYVLNTEKMYFEILEDGKIQKATLKNKKKEGTAVLHKVDEDGNSVEGVLIGIYSLDDELIDSKYTDKDGNIEITLKYGSYYFKEIETLENLILSDEKVYFDITEDGEYIQKTLINEFEEIEVPDTSANSNINLVASIVIIVGSLIIIISKNKNNKLK